MPTSDLLNTWINHDVFNDVVEKIFSKSGYQVFREWDSSGFQMRVMKDNEHSLVRCKSWGPLRMVDVSDLVGLYGHMLNQNLETGWFICISDFTFEAYNYGRNRRIILVDGESLLQMFAENGFSLADVTAKRKTLDL